MTRLVDLKQVIGLGEVGIPKLRKQWLAKVKKFILRKVLGHVGIIRMEILVRNPIYETLIYAVKLLYRSTHFRQQDLRPSLRGR